MNLPPIDFAVYHNIVVLTGAGISVASGLRTYRGEEGLWKEFDPEKLSHIDTFTADPSVAWQFYSKLRGAVQSASPNAAHHALVEFERRLSNHQAFTLITQNVDGLHLAAGSNNVVEMHGAIYKTRCANEGCASVPFVDSQLHQTAPLCTTCGGMLRPDIVLFGEMIPASADYQIRKAFRNCDLFLAVGTSGTVYPACNFVRAAKFAGAHTILVNLESIPSQSAFDTQIEGRAEEALPLLLTL